jgi:hypothetical protein
MDTVTEQLPFSSFQFTITEVESVLLDLNDGNGPGHLFSKAARVILLQQIFNFYSS